ncbi:thymidylate kinase [Anguillid herpesvirus 1]|uniref:dTMP kinase n=1 Tax=Anguillid herpesvirus 1 TaxID=150286 RepID=A0A1J0REA7_9VIRU|nr:thymidylate kinase [Anguillid herpesvirus 1]ADA57840.2 thymidylate kinase [Anguillid herpesvirus 1]APD76239.1 thymidylate kinase [Anguillid herpesvirus 1]QRM16370.1 thymidylate kinase [Anguillid herpesvirus 1]QRM16498.1 thymidylate kinase [Anguillid herpesvirus 1]QRM16629.1 thymidylate kinase [Anguillid herpesvirus 1]
MWRRLLMMATDSAHTATAAIKIGRLIAVEGCDRTGKSTLCARLAETWPESITAVHFPKMEGTFTGSVLRTAFKTPFVRSNPRIMHLLFSANRWELMDFIGAELAKGKIVVCDRYFGSGLAYSMVKGLDQEWCEGPDRRLIQPDATIYLDAPLSALMKRKDWGADTVFETEEFQSKLIPIYDKLAREKRWTRIDADLLDADAVYTLVEGYIFKHQLRLESFV